MKNKIFSSGDYYDLFYEDKDYQLEANYIHKKIQEYKLNAYSILELGCGTGKHAINLTKFGYKILGIYFAHHQFDGAFSRFPSNASNKSLSESQISGFEVDIAGLFG